MTEDNRRKLWKLIVEAGDYLRDQRYTLVDLGSPWFTVVMRTI